MSAWLDAAQAAQGEPLGTPPADLFFTFTRPDGDTFITSAANAEAYLRQGFTVTGEMTLSDSDAQREAISPGSLEAPVSGAHLSEATGTSGAMPPAEPAP